MSRHVGDILAITNKGNGRAWSYIVIKNITNQNYNVDWFCYNRSFCGRNVRCRRDSIDEWVEDGEYRLVESKDKMKLVKLILRKTPLIVRL